MVSFIVSFVCSMKFDESASLTVDQHGYSCRNLIKLLIVYFDGFDVSMGSSPS